MLAKTELKVTLVVPRCPPKLAEMIREREILRVAASNIAEKCCTCQLFMMNVEGMKKKSGS